MASHRHAAVLVTHDRHLMNSLACPILYLLRTARPPLPQLRCPDGPGNAPAPAVQKAAELAKTGYGREQAPLLRRAARQDQGLRGRDGCLVVHAKWSWTTRSTPRRCTNHPDLLRQKSDELSDLRFHQEELFAAWEAAMEEQESL